MEVLSNLWSILTTENEMMTKIITAPTVIIELWLSYMLITRILKIKNVPRSKFCYILFLSISALITEFIIQEPLNLFVNFIVVYIVIKVIVKQNIIKSVLGTILPTIIFALIGTLVLKPFLILFKLTYSDIVTIPIYRLMYLFIMYLITGLSILIIKNKRLIFNINEDFNKDNKKVILFNLLLGFFTLAVQLTITVLYTDILPSYIIFLSFVSLFAYFFISIYSLTRTMKLQITTTNLESAENYNATLSYLYDNVKAFQHDFNNMIFIIGGYIEANDTEGLKKYYKNLEKDCERVNNVALLNPKLINNSGIYNLLMSKYKKANEKNVEIKLEFFFDFEKLKMPIYDFSRMLGILLDNAIEAAKETEEKYVNILFRDSSRNNTQIISIENTYKNKEVDTNRIFEKGVTEKNEHIGMGLWEVKQILKRNNNVNLITTKDNIYFKQNLEIYY